MSVNDEDIRDEETEASFEEAPEPLSADDTMGVPAPEEAEGEGDEPAAAPDREPARAPFALRADMGAEPDSARSVDDVLDSDAGRDDEKPEWALPKAELMRVVEALLFASGKVTTLATLAKAVPEARTREVREVLRELVQAWSDPARGIHLEEVNAGFQFRTSAVAAPYIREMLKAKPLRLSRAAIETLAIVAYRQPLTRAEIEDVRGVDSGGVMKLLLDKRLVRILGKREEPGRPIIYGTTKDFLELFHLRSLKELPTLQDFHELNAENRAKLAAAVSHEEPTQAPAEEEDPLFKVPETLADSSHSAQELARAAENLELAIREADAAVAEVLGRKPYEEREGEEDGADAGAVEVLGVVGGANEGRKPPRDKGLRQAAKTETDAHDEQWQEPPVDLDEDAPERDEESEG